MSERSAPDPAGTARRIAALAERSGLRPAEVLRIEGEGGLSFASGLEPAAVDALLRGRPVTALSVVRGGDAELEERPHQVVDRILFLRRTRLKESPDGSRRTYSLAEIAAGAGTSAQWLDKMIKTGKAPNLNHADGIAAFFGESIEFLVAEPTEALDRVLQRIYKDLLERTVARQDEDLQRLRDREAAAPGAEHGVVNYAARALADVPDDTAQPIIALIESIARRSREDRAREQGAGGS